MTPDQYPKKQDISLLPRTVDVTINMLSAADKLLFELEQVRNTTENINQLPILIFDKFIQLLPALNNHCEEWRLYDLTADQLKQIEGIECRLGVLTPKPRHFLVPQALKQKGVQYDMMF
jgi:hypothetical protein